MSAEDLGTRELGQVRSQRLDELLTTLRLLHDPSSNSKIGVPALDKLLANHTTRFDPTNLSAIPAPPIIEITSPVPKSGKTQFLYWVIANLVLGGDGLDPPEQTKAEQADDSVEDDMRTTSDHAEDEMTQPTKEHSGPDASTAVDTAHQAADQPDQPRHNSTPQTNLPKQSNQTTPKAVALLSTSPVNIPRLSQILLQHLLITTPDLSLAEAQPIIFTALSHIHIYQPSSLSSLIATVSSLPSYFLSASNTSKERKLGAIAISTPSSYFWEDKFAITTTSATSASTTGKYPALATTLRRVSTTLQTPVFYTTSHFSGSSTSSSSSNPLTLALPPTLPPPFAILPSLRLIISRSAIKGFNKEVDAETALKHREARDIAMQEARFRVQGNRSAGNERIETQRDTGFEIKIGGRGVKII